jgi:hypothetical protein
MEIEREVLETIVRCVSIMVCYHNEPTEEARRQMVEEIGIVAARVTEGLNFPRGEAEAFLGQVDQELYDRYGAEVGTRLTDEFAEAFQGAASQLGPRRADRPGGPPSP